MYCNISLNCFFLTLFLWFDTASTSISLRSPCFKDAASREVSFGKIFPSHLLLFRISPRRKLHPVYIPVSKFGNSPVSTCVNLQFFNVLIWANRPTLLRNTYVVWFPRLCYISAVTNMSLSERPSLYDIMGGSLKI